MNSVGLFDFLEVSIWSKTNKKYKEVKYRTSQKSIDMSYDKQTQKNSEKNINCIKKGIEQYAGQSGKSK